MIKGIVIIEKERTGKDGFQSRRKSASEGKRGTSVIAIGGKTTMIDLYVWWWQVKGVPIT